MLSTMLAQSYDVGRQCMSSCQRAGLAMAPLCSRRKVAAEVDLTDLPEDLGKIATTLLEDKTGTQARDMLCHAALRRAAP